ncbi:hypothetical protein TNCV_2731171 [Trichonephila clavipes]|nr:hypothetical protein TNCV_2731171 [Trichonephila clavipes]
MYNIYTFVEIISDPIIGIFERSFFTLADGAKYSFSSRRKSQLQISTLRSRVELTDPNHSRPELKADYRYPHCAHGWSSQIPTVLVEKVRPTTYGLVLAHSQSF